MNIENQIICGDSLEVLKEIPDNAIDAIITDPVWPDVNIELPGKGRELELLTGAAKQFPRLTGRVILHLGQMTDPRLLSAIPPELPFVQACWLRYFPPMYRGPVLVSADVAYVFGHSRLPGDGSRVFGAECNSSASKTKGFEARNDPANNHPCPRSITHVSWLIRRFTRPGQLILDPFCGSATTCIAAKLAGRRYCGIDIHQPFVDYAKHRLSEPYLFPVTEHGCN